KIRAMLCGLSIAYRDRCYGARAQLIDDPMVAVEDRRFTHITYHSPRSAEPLSYPPVHSYGLVWHKNSLHFVSPSEQHDEFRTLKVDRISDVAFERCKFDKPVDFNIHADLRHSLGVFHDDGPPQHVVNRFAPSVARYIEDDH